MGWQKMTPQEIAVKAVSLQREANGLPDPGYSNYKQVLAAYRQILNDVLVLIRELASNTGEKPNG